jgi:hypothetical protein
MGTVLEGRTSDGDHAPMRGTPVIGPHSPATNAVYPVMVVDISALFAILLLKRDTQRFTPSKGGNYRSPLQC